MVGRNQIAGKVPARILYSRGELLKLQCLVTTPPDVPDEIRRRREQGRRTETRRIISCVSFSEDVNLHKAETAWKPSVKKNWGEQDPEMARTQEMFGRMRGILNKLTLEKFEQLMKQVAELSLNTEDRLEGIGNIIFEKAISEPKFASTYAKMCHCLKEDNNRQHLKKSSEDVAQRRRAVGNMKFLGELFKLDMVKDVIIHGCIAVFLDTKSQETLECLCCLITTTGPVLDCENIKPRMDGYFIQMESILKEGKTTSRICFMLQDVMDLRQNNWVSLRGEQGPKTISQVHEETKLENQLEIITVQSNETRKIISGVSFSMDVKLHKVDNAWRPSIKNIKVEQVTETAETHELFGRMRSILNKLTPDKFEQLMKQVTELSMTTEDRLEGIGSMIFEKAICELKFTSTYAKMCQCLKELTVPCNDDPAVNLNFRLLMLHLCRKEFFKVNGDGKMLEKEWQNLNAADMEEGRQHLKEELGTKVIAHRRRAVGSMRLLGELFKLDMVRDVVILGCIVTFLDTQSEVALECTCCLITTTGSILDCENVKPQLDGCFSKLKQILNEGKTTSRIRFMLEDVMDLRQNNWVPRRDEQVPKTINQVHLEAELENQLEIRKVEESRNTTPVTTDYAPTNIHNESDPAVQEIDTKPAVQEMDAEPAVEIDTEPAVQEMDAEPAVENDTKPAVQEIDIEPAVQENDTEPAVQEIDTEPAVQEMNVEPAVQETVIEPAVQEIDIETAVQETVIEPAVQEIDIETAVQEIDIEPAVQAIDIEPAVQETVIEPAVQDTEPAVQEIDIEPAVQDTVIEPAVQDTEPAVQEIDIEPAVQENDIEPAVQENDTEPAVQEIVIKPAVEGNDTEPAVEIDIEPAVQEIVIKPAVENDTEPAVQEIDIGPAVQETVIEPAVQEIVIKPAVENDTEPAVEGNDTEPAVQENDIEPAVQEIDTEPAVQEIDIEPAVQEIDTEPAVQEIDIEPAVQETVIEPAVQEIDTEPAVQEIDIEPAVQETVIEPAVQEIDIEPAVQETVIEPAVQDTEPAVQEIDIEPAVQETVTEPAVQEIDVEPAVQETVIEPAVQDIEPAVAIDTGPAVKEDTVSANFTTVDTSQSCEIPKVQNSGTHKIISGVSFSKDVKLHKVENAWRPSIKKDKVEQDPEKTVTQELFRRMRSILNKLTPEKFEQLVNQVAELNIDTTERLQGVVDIVFEKAIFEPKFASTYAKMCHRLKELNAPLNDCLEATLNFHLAILNRCWVEFDQVNERVLRPKEELEANVAASHRRSLGNVKFLGELFNLEMAEEFLMHRCITTLLDNQGEKALECLCCLLSTIGRNLDCDKNKCHIDKYLRKMEQILKEGKTSSRIRFMLQDIMDLRQPGPQ
ncbi:eukaryotic translation initiation factor 4 gamma 1-like [Anguilla anguilla]|uniref:eukaryotic translation initiation factor 4 gamma 1-like n=1 Tax=Anguilla anguilla TaxID=7936 RepID=UPI0015A82C1D|nr:eukaryotic translation initiation factor 4 gamma 1-like [Anguilla anguilla]